MHSWARGNWRRPRLASLVAIAFVPAATLASTPARVRDTTSGQPSPVISAVPAGNGRLFAATSHGAGVASPNTSGASADPGPCEQGADNCQTHNGHDGLSANRVDFRTADNFSPALSGAVTTVCWSGTYSDESGLNCQGSEADAFEIRYFTDAGGFPGVLQSSFSQEAGTLTLQGPIATGDFVADVLPEYAFQATHDGVPVLAGRQYWIEISNSISGCVWYWETAWSTDGRALQDGGGEPSPAPPNGYGAEDVIQEDLAFCVNLPLPPPAPNNRCDLAEVISGTGPFSFENTFASTDGPGHAACDPYRNNQRQITHDVWYCWTSPCTETVLVGTCGLTPVDTRLAAYRGCDCPPSEADLAACDDDLCGAGSDAQSMIRFQATAGESYLLRVGTYPLAGGGVGRFEITCGPPSQSACGGTGSCCDAKSTPGCADQACCETICACDPFCCETAWDEDCAGSGYNGSGCGAGALCGCQSVCGQPDSGDCCGTSNTPGCSNRRCCEQVCECDPYCCETGWDELCATTGTKGDCGAALLCTELCSPQCPAGPIRWLDPPQMVLDARRPHDPGNAADAAGIASLRVEAPAGAARRECWSLCESPRRGAVNTIASINWNPDRTLTINLTRPISPGAVTQISYRDDAGTRQSAVLTYHPANANADVIASPQDVADLASELRGAAPLPWGPFQRDIDRSGMFTAADVLEAVDLLNGAGYAVWDGTPEPIVGTACP